MYAQYFFLNTTQGHVVNVVFVTTQLEQIPYTITTLQKYLLLKRHELIITINNIQVILI